MPVPTLGTPFVSSAFSRVSSVLSQNVIMGNLRASQEELLRIQEQLATGLRILRPSDDAIGANRILEYNIQINRNEQYVMNITTANGRLAISDNAVGEVNEIADRARETLLAQVQSTATATSRALAAQEIMDLLRSALNQGNTQFEDRFLFAGSLAESAPFVMAGDQVAFLGDLREFQANISSGFPVATNISADDAFGVISDEFLGRDLATLNPIDLDPSVVSGTTLASLNAGRGAARGQLQITGSVGTQIVDLRTAEDIGDVIVRINAKAALTGVTAAINAAGNGLTLTDSGAGTIYVSDLLNGTTATDLGIATPGTGSASPVVGADIDPAITMQTQLWQLNGGAGFDFTGFTVTNGSYSATFSSGTSASGIPILASGTTVQQFLNAVNGANLFVEARISETGQGFDILSRLSGARLSISEAGGSTAADLGLLSTLERAKIENLNGGLGVSTIKGADLMITLRNGARHFVDVDNVTTVAELVTALNNLTGLSASVNASGGITLTDTVSGTGVFTVENYNGSFTATNLGIDGPASGGVVSGTGLTYVGEQVTGIFTALISLRDALLANNVEGINAAGRLLDRVQAERMNETRSNAGSRMSQLELTANRLEFENTELARFRSQTRDLDMAEAATRFSIKETVLQASLAVASRVLQTSIFNFI